MEPEDVDGRIENAKRGLEEKLSELQRRVDHTKEALSPSHYLRNPWVRFGAGVAGGYVAARVLGIRPVRSAVRKLVVFAASAFVREAIAEWRRRNAPAGAAGAGVYGRGPEAESGVSRLFRSASTLFRGGLAPR
jgi:hypothetical protein